MNETAETVKRKTKLWRVEELSEELQKLVAEMANAGHKIRNPSPRVVQRDYILFGLGKLAKIEKPRPGIINRAICEMLDIDPRENGSYPMFTITSIKNLTDNQRKIIKANKGEDLKAKYEEIKSTKRQGGGRGATLVNVAEILKNF